MTPHRTTLVGRDHPRRVVHDHLCAGSSVLLEGPAGIGKSLLGTSVLRQPPCSARLVATMIGTRETSAVALATLASGAPLPRRASPTQIYATLVDRWTRSLAPGSRPLIYLDDAHLVDATTAAFLRIGIDAGSLQLLACRRTPGPLPEHLAALLTSGLLVSHTVAPLTDAAIRRVIGQHAPVAPTAGTVDQIVALARGNPLYARELARTITDGSLPDLHQSLESLVGRAVLDCDPPARRLLELVAVAQPVPMSLLVARRDAQAELRRRGLLLCDGKGDVRVDHPLRREWILADLGAGASQTLAAFIDAVGVETVRRLDPVRYVEWCRLAARPVEAAELREAVSSALARDDPRTALSLLDGDPIGPQATAPDPDGLRAQALLALGRTSEGIAALEERLRLGAPTPALALACVRHFALGQQDTARAEQVVRDLVECSGPDTRLAALNCEVWLANFCGLSASTPLDDWAQTASTEADPDRRAELQAGIGKAILLRDGPGRARPLIETSGQRVGRADWTTSHGRPATVQLMQGLASGDLATALPRMHAALHLARQHHDIESQLWIAGAGSLALAIAGQVSRAVETSRSVDVYHRADGWFRFHGMVELIQAGTAAYLRETTHLDRLCGPVDGPGIYPLARARAADLAAGFRSRNEEVRDKRAGQHDDDAVHHALEILAGRGHYLYAALLGLEVTDLTTASDVQEHLADIVPAQMDGVADVCRGAARARLSLDPAELVRLARRAEQSGWVVPALRLYGDVLRLADDQDVGPVARGAVLRLLAAWQGEDPWWLPPLPTLRQREIAQLIAAGPSSRQIATELRLSTRTVDNHLQKVFDFVGVHDRAQLGVRLGGAAAAPRG